MSREQKKGNPERPSIVKTITPKSVTLIHAKGTAPPPPPAPQPRARSGVTSSRTKPEEAHEVVSLVIYLQLFCTDTLVDDDEDLRGVTNITAVNAAAAAVGRIQVVW